MKLSPLHFQLSIIIIEKWLPNSPRQWLADSPSWRLPDSAAPWLGGWRLPDLTRRRISDSASRRIWQFWAIPAAFNHRFIQKIIALLLNGWFLPKNIRWIYRKSIDKSDKSDKSSEDIKKRQICFDECSTHLLFKTLILSKIYS
jgi:hypothetical protein